MVNPTGYTALDLIGFTDKGTYLSSENYVKNDLVHYGGNIWRCLIDDTSRVEPAEGVNWTLFIEEPTNLVERIIAPVETNPATNAYAVGKQLIFNGLLCKATSVIAVGDTLAVGTNLALSDNVVEQIYSLNQGLTNSLANISHENLLDNPWFTVNQRGIDSTTETWTQNIIGVDRWKNFSNTKKLILTADGVSELEGGIVTLYQVFDTENDTAFINIYGKVVTISILYADGTIDSGTALVPLNHLRPQSRQDVRFITNTEHTSFVQIESYDIRSNVVIEGKAGNIIRAIKLELGSVSTLAMDTAPNYTTELAKCQRYFYRMYAGTGSNPWIAIGMVWSSNIFNTIVPIPPMRTSPTITCGDLSDLIASKGSTATNPKTISSLVPAAFDTCKRQMVIAVHCNETDLTMGSMYALKFGTKTQKNNWIDFSADL
jgi:hypothetical protein